MDVSMLQFNPSDPAAWQDRMVHGNAPEAERLQAASREFESILLRQYLDKALQPLTKSGGIMGSKSPVYGYLVTNALASSLSSGGVFGFSNLMQAQISGASENTNDESANTSQ